MHADLFIQKLQISYYCSLTRCFFYLENFAEVVEKVEVENYEKLAEELLNASPLEIMDKALEKFGNDIAIAFRYISLTA